MMSKDVNAKAARTYIETTSKDANAKAARTQQEEMSKDANAKGVRHPTFPFVDKNASSDLKGAPVQPTSATDQMFQKNNKKK